jgi:hypothetical protein
MMSEKLPRQANIGGMYDDEQWENILSRVSATDPELTVIEFISRSALSAELQVNPEQMYEGPVVNKDDFLSFASTQEDKADKSRAPRAWNVLTQLYNYKANARFWSKMPGFKSARFEFVPLVFNVVPEGREPEDLSYERGLGDLELGSLEKLLEIVDQELEGVPAKDKTEILTYLLWNQANLKILDFLHRFAKDSRERHEATKSEQDEGV